MAVPGLDPGIGPVIHDLDARKKVVDGLPSQAMTLKKRQLPPRT
jgi:hypothetical protein